jgi:N-acetylmuramoyl-L-alanine amidase
MISVLFFLLFSSRDLNQHAVQAFHMRYILLLGISQEAKPLPWSLVNASRPPQRLKKRFLPMDLYETADRNRNRRLYGEDTVFLQPTMVVMHFTVVDDAESIIYSFERPSRLAVGNQEPVTSLISVHYMVDVDGTIFQLAPENRITSGTYGVDHRALAIEMVAKNEEDLMSRPLQLLSAFYLVDGLLKKHNIPVWRVFSHQEVASGKLFLSDYTDLADTLTPYFYPKPHFRYDPGANIMAWCREFLLRQRNLWKDHPASAYRK